MVIGVAALAAASSACEANFEPQSIVIDLRVLAMQANPPEVIVDVDPRHPDPSQLTIPDVHLRALVADPGPTRRLAWHALACAPTGTGRCSLIVDPEDPHAPILDLGGGVIEDPEDLPAAPGVDILFHATPELLMTAIDAAPLGGIDGVVVQIELRVAPEGDSDEKDAVYAEKGVVFTPRLPMDKQANRNPTLTDMTADGAPWSASDCTIVVAPGAEVDLMPIEDPMDLEVYQLERVDGGADSFMESLRYQWFATAGEFSDDQTGGPKSIFGEIPNLDTKWTAPAMAGPVSFYVVQRDERGGATWVQRCLTVGP